MRRRIALTVGTISLIAGAFAIPAMAAQRAVFYENCDAARAAGAAPIHVGEPGYRKALDRDGDGIACEDSSGSSTGSGVSSDTPSPTGSDVSTDTPGFTG